MTQLDDPRTVQRICTVLRFRFKWSANAADAKRIEQVLAAILEVHRRDEELEEKARQPIASHGR